MIETPGPSRWYWLGRTGEADGTPRAAYGRAGASQTARSALTGGAMTGKSNVRQRKSCTLLRKGHCGTLRDGV